MRPCLSYRISRRAPVASISRIGRPASSKKSWLVPASADFISTIFAALGSTADAECGVVSDVADSPSEKAVSRAAYRGERLQARGVFMATGTVKRMERGLLTVRLKSESRHPSIGWSAWAGWMSGW